MLSKALTGGFLSNWMSVFFPNFLLQKFQVSSYEYINGLGKWFVSMWKWGLRFIVLTAWLTKQVCTLWTLGALLGVANVMNEAKQFSESISGHWREKSLVFLDKPKPNFSWLHLSSVESLQIDRNSHFYLKWEHGMSFNWKPFRLILSTIQSSDLPSRYWRDVILLSYEMPTSSVSSFFYSVFLSLMHSNWCTMLNLIIGGC